MHCFDTVLIMDTKQKQLAELFVNVSSKIQMLKTRPVETKKLRSDNKR